MIGLEDVVEDDDDAQEAGASSILLKNNRENVSNKQTNKQTNNNSNNNTKEPNTTMRDQRQERERDVRRYWSLDSRESTIEAESVRLYVLAVECCSRT